uniref:Uncharacterized protein n=1 Tax=Arundo donax TaxID=35708 RepID=A0A0A8ZSJ5_ARUDO
MKAAWAAPLTRLTGPLREPTSRRK